MEITITMKIENEELKDLLGLQGETKKVRVRRKTSASPYAKFFDETCTAWTKDPESNKFYLLRQQEYANEKLKQYGYLFLNEVYDMLGMPRTKAGQLVGWVYDETRPYIDNFVDFGLFDSRNRDFINGYEKTVLLDFNVDGNIFDYMEKEL